jgi:hypothetical protein
MDAAGGVTTRAVDAMPPDHAIAPATVPIAIIGTDAVLAATPATPVQFAHACLRAGFANVIPASWGDELIAAAVLRRLPQFGNGPVIQCSCPIVAHRLLAASGDLRPVLLPLVPPPVAVARYVRSLARPSRTRITYIGACPGAIDESIDIRMSPEALIAMLAERDISIVDQPEVFESIIPPDRRRFRSQPGGVPTAEALWTEFGARTLVEIDGEDFVTEVAQQLLAGKNVLIDASTRLGCACSGATSGARNPRAHVVALEPPRATSPVIEERTPIDLDLPVPAVSRTPVDVTAVSTTAATHAATPATGSDAIGPHRPPAARTSGPNPEIRPRLSTPVVPRAVLSAFPQTRDLEGKALPRAFVARRRSSPRGLSAVLPHEEFTSPVAEAVESELSPAQVETGSLPARHDQASPAPAVVATEAVLPIGGAAVVPAPVMPDSVLAAEPPRIPTEADSVAAAAVVAAVETPPLGAPAIAAPRAPMQTPSPSPAPAPAMAALTVSDPEFAGRSAPATHDDIAIAAVPTEAARRSSAPRTPPRSLRPVPPSPATRVSPLPAPASFSRAQIILIFVAVTAIAICASTVVGVIVSRSVTAASLSTPPAR